MSNDNVTSVRNLDKALFARLGLYATGHKISRGKALTQAIQEFLEKRDFMPKKQP